MRASLPQSTINLQNTSLRMTAIKWCLAAILTAIFFVIGGAIIELVFIGIGKLAQLSGSASDKPPSYLITLLRRASGFFFGSTLAVYAVVRLVRDLNTFLYLKIFSRLIIAVQALVVVFSIVMIGFNTALVLIIAPVFECLGALFGASYGFSLALTKEKNSKTSSDF